MTLLDGVTTPKEVLGDENAAHDATHKEAQTDEIIFIFYSMYFVNETGNKQ